MMVGTVTRRKPSKRCAPNLLAVLPFETENPPFPGTTKFFDASSCSWLALPMYDLGSWFPIPQSMMCKHFWQSDWLIGKTGSNRNYSGKTTVTHSKLYKWMHASNIGISVYQKLVPVTNMCRITLSMEHNVEVSILICILYNSLHGSKLKLMQHGCIKQERSQYLHVAELHTVIIVKIHRNPG